MAAAMSAQAPAAGDIVQYLLSRGATLPGGGESARALVNSALDAYGAAQMLPIVLAQIKDINTLGSDGLSLLHKAVERDDADSARLVLEHGIRVDVRAADGATPLLLAVERGNKSMVRLLLDQKADPNARDRQGENALALLLRGAYIPVGNEGGYSRDGRDFRGATARRR